ncbi:hypothetical protein PG993_005439 [Apiospora rasikravindrae]|uniref:Uncharacterized protein n=1 Tax=Apiospora rasikravindrae TaxID=990691 RepID=A0ABR1TFK2_9PEZI
MAGGFNESEDEDPVDDDGDAAAPDDDDDNMLVELENTLAGEEMEEEVATGVNKMQIEEDQPHEDSRLHLNPHYLPSPPKPKEKSVDTMKRLRMIIVNSPAVGRQARLIHPI